jgi:flagellar protein FlgJ
MSGGDLSTANALALDARSLNHIKLQAGKDSPAAVKEAAKQFESLFMRELIKSMREATMKSGLLDSAQGDLASDMLDQQLSVQMSGRPGGLSDVIAQQLSRQMGVSEQAGSTVGRAASKAAIQPAPGASAAPTASQTSFVQRFNQVAAKVEQSSGIPAGFMLGQAGHETGWGRREIMNADGSTSFNLFGIKAGPGWKGKVAEVTTTEYVDGVPRKTVAKFRAYNSYEESFRDYARLITESPRYAQVRQQTGSVQAFASGLQRAGYATDPAYASKLSRAINTTLQLQRAMA